MTQMKEQRLCRPCWEGCVFNEYFQSCFPPTHLSLPCIRERCNLLLKVDDPAHRDSEGLQEWNSFIWPSPWTVVQGEPQTGPVVLSDIQFVAFPLAFKWIRLFPHSQNGSYAIISMKHHQSFLQCRGSQTFKCGKPPFFFLLPGCCFATFSQLT